jgi:endonuclease YncB( thermonuclease family)
VDRGRPPSMKLLSSLTAAMLLASSVQSIAQTIVTDGDTFRFTEGRIVRMFGIDAPESAQVCNGWPAGREATQYLQKLMANRQIVCHDKGRDRYGRWVAQCFDGEIDLGREMVREGYAWAFVRYSNTFVAEEQLARQEKLGVHAHGCRPAWEWRQLQKLHLGLEEK